MIRGMGERSVDGRVAAIGGRQHGLLTRPQVLAVGFTQPMIRHRLSTGRWAPVAPGVYRVAGLPITWRQRALAAVLVSGPGAVLSHQSAAHLLEVDGFRPGHLHVTVPRGRSNRNALATVHRTTTLTRADVVVVDRVPVTGPPRLLVDLAGAVARDRLERAVDDVLVRGLAAVDAVVARVERAGTLPGRSALVASLEPWRQGTPAGSGAEVRLARLLVGAGLPAPVRQHEVRCGGRLVARLDLAYPRARVGIEVDGYRWHGTPGAFERDRRRHNRVEAAGWRLLHVAAADVERGAPDVVSTVAALLAAAERGAVGA